VKFAELPGYLREVHTTVRILRETMTETKREKSVLVGWVLPG